MKNIFKILVVLFTLSFVACNKPPLDEVNIDPNTSPSANDAQLLTSAEGFLGYVVDVDLNSNSFLWAQYYTWGIGVSIGNEERFVAQPSDYNGYWQRAYANCLTDLKVLKNSESAAYRGIGTALEVYIYQGLVDHFGDVPYSQAVKGAIEDGSILTPTYDGAATIYGNLVTSIDEALVDLRKGSSGDVGTDDLVFGGDLNKWIKFANSLKLRLLMRTSEQGGNDAAIVSLISGGDFIESSDDLAAVPFSGDAGSENPMFARFEWGVGDFYFASNATLNVLTGLVDPRADAFYTPASTGSFAGQIYGIDQGTIDDEPFTNPDTHYSGSAPAAYGAANSVVLMSDWEVWFLRSEADARYGTADDGEAAFTTAISNNFAYLGVADGGYAAAQAAKYSSAADMDAKLDLIGVQKWIAMNGTQEDEGWIEARRFDRPASRLFTGGIFQDPPLSVLGAGNFPASWLYPATEMSLNPSAPAQRSLTEKIFWDN